MTETQRTTRNDESPFGTTSASLSLHRTKKHCSICRHKQAMWLNETTGVLLCDWCRAELQRQYEVSDPQEDR